MITVSALLLLLPLPGSHTSELRGFVSTHPFGGCGTGPREPDITAYAWKEDKAGRLAKVEVWANKDRVTRVIVDCDSFERCAEVRAGIERRAVRQNGLKASARRMSRSEVFDVMSCGGALILSTQPIEDALVCDLLSEQADVRLQPFESSRSKRRQ